MVEMHMTRRCSKDDGFFSLVIVMDDFSRFYLGFNGCEYLMHCFSLQKEIVALGNDDLIQGYERLCLSPAYMDRFWKKVSAEKPEAPLSSHENDF